MFNWSSILGRFIAAGLSVVCVWLADKTGVQITAEEQQGMAASLTMLGSGLLLALYAGFHKLINAKLSPADGAAKVTATPQGMLKMEPQ